MNPYTKGATFLIRMVAFGFIVVGMVYLGSYAFYYFGQKKITDPIWQMVLKSLPFFLGFILLFKSGSIAKKLTDDLGD